MNIKKNIILVIICSFIYGCSTNAIIDPNKIRITDSLVSQTEMLEDEILEANEKKAHEINNLRTKLMNLRRELENELGEKNIYLEKIKQGLKLTILNKVLFSSGRADINKQGNKILTKIADILKNTNQPVQVVGHTDNEPIRRTKYLYKSNWDLSIKRAINVIHLFQDVGVEPAIMFAVGQGEYMPAFSNKTKKGRAKNRRVEIILGVDLEKTTDTSFFSKKKKKDDYIK